MRKGRTRAPGILGLGLPGCKAAMVLVAVALACCARLPALDPSLDISQYAHTAWKVRDGFVKGYIDSVAQTPDGYLWLGTEFGLVRFDGVRATPWQPPSGQHLPSDMIGNLLLARDGTLWIGTLKGLASWKDGKLTTYPEMTGQDVHSLLQTRDATVWAGTIGLPNSAKLCAIRNARFDCSGGDGTLGNDVSSLYEDGRGSLWMGVSNGVWRWGPGPREFSPLPGRMGIVHCLAGSEDGALLIGTSNGIKRLVNNRFEAYALPAGAPQGPVQALLRDQDGSLWIATFDRGLFHLHQGKIDPFSVPDGLSGNDASAFLEDREGNVWVATNGGLDRFRAYSIPTLSLKQGLSSDAVGSVLADRHGTVWIGTLAGLDRWEQGSISAFGPSKGAQKPDGKLNGLLPNSLFEDSGGRIWASTVREFGYLENGRYVTVTGYPAGYVHDIVEGPPGHLWLASQQGGLLHVFQGKVIEQFPWSHLGHEEGATAITFDPHGGLWLGFFRGGVAHFADGAVRVSYSSADGLGEGRVDELRFGPRGDLWAATERGLSRIRDGHISTLTSKNGLPCDAVQWTMEDDDHAVWLYMPCGLVRVARTESDAWVANPKRMVEHRVFDISEGVQTHYGAGGFRPLVTKTSDGKIWFTAYDGIRIIDPRHLPFNKLPPPVEIEQITADHKIYGGDSRWRLPPLIHDLEIDYTALSFVVPEKVLFRYKLEPRDRGWQDAGNRRQAFYTDLAPGRYRFHVMACNNSGVWNETGASLDFSIDPAYYQAAWFRLLCVAGLLGLLYGYYRFRLLQQAQHFNMRLEERINERTRIARELHDTLLQSFQGVLLKLYAATTAVRQAEARERLEGLLEQGEQAIAEGRDAVQGMRSSTVIKNDLACTLTEVGERLTPGHDAQNPIAFVVTVEGETKDLHPILRDEVYRIASEAIRNGFRHSGARRIEVEIHYGDRQLRVRVLDNGRGIDAKVLDGGGRKGHFGLPGMSERAKLAGGKLTVLSKPGSGTEVELTIPASRAYARFSPVRDQGSGRG